MKNSTHDDLPPHDPAAPESTGATHPDPLATDAGHRVPSPETTTPADPYPSSSGGKLGSMWVALVLGAIVTILLLVFIVQNNVGADMKYFGWQFSLPLGVLVLLAAIAGALIMALFAGVRILQLRMRAHRARKLARH